MAHQIENNPLSKWLIFFGMIAAVLAAASRYVIQPLFSHWVFATLKRDPAKLAELLEKPLADIARTLGQIRECQSEQGEEIAFIAGQMRGRSE